MKKNRMMRLASGLLVAVLLTTSMISGTFAKYVTEVEAFDQARVAKWGVEITNSANMFEKTYDSDTTGYISQTVISTTDEVLAPGTTGTLAAVTVSGTPEVAVKVTYDATLELTGWGDYFPVEIKVNSDTFKVGVDGVTKDNIASKVEAAIEAYTSEHPANQAISSAATPEVTWTWAYVGNDDVKDTNLGNLASAPKIKLTVKAIATQID